MTALEKAKGALDSARSLVEEFGAEMPAEVDRQYLELIAVSRVQATIAQAEALALIADSAQRTADILGELVDRLPERVG